MKLKKLFARTPGQRFNTFRTRFGRFSDPVCNHDPCDIMAFITTRCNFLCNTCPYTHESPYSPAPDIPDISTDLFRKILRYYRRASVIGLVGGEPLLHPELDQLIGIAAGMKMTVNLSTNASLLTEERARKLLKSPLGFLNISLDAADPAEYLRLRGGDEKTYQMILSNTRRLADLQKTMDSPVQIVLSFVTDAHNVTRIPDFARLGIELGADQVFCQTMLSYDCSDITSGTGSLQDTPEVRQRIAGLDIPDGITVVPPQLIPLDDDCRCVHCVHPFKMLSFDGAGNLSPCCILPPHPRYGNLQQDPDAWRKGKELMDIRQSMLDERDAFADICLDCWERFTMGQHLS